MARWKITAPHYLNVVGSEWEYSENDRMTGKPKRIKFPVPTLLHPDDPTNWNANFVRNPRGELLGGDIIVAHATGKQEAADYVFEGDPTPEMEPLDKEAAEISAKFSKAWERPPETSGMPYGDALIQAFQQKFDVSDRKVEASAQGITDVLAAMTQLMKQNQELMATLAGGARRA